MGLATFLTNLTKVSVACIGLLLSFFTIVDLTLFLSDPKYIAKNKNNVVDSEDGGWTWTLFVNTSLLSLFIMSHSMLAMQKVKDWFKNSSFHDLQRSFYVIVTCVTLQVLLKNWCISLDMTLWEIKYNSIFYYTCVVTHVVVWLLIYIATVCMDISELLGLKQVYYSLKHLPNPLNQKSYELCQLYSHMRHPSFIGFLIIFWLHPIMTLDRVLLSSMLTLYMYVAWNTDARDLQYQRYQYEKKFKSY